MERKSDVNSRLVLLKSIYGGNVMLTNGLYHIMVENHSEAYINNSTNEIDNRGRYRTIIVGDDTVVANVVGDKHVKSVILRKADLKLLYASNELIHYINQDILYNSFGDIVSMDGSVLCKLNHFITKVDQLGMNYYLVKADTMYGDALLHYIPHVNKIQNYTEGKKYIISKVRGENTILEVIDMYGGRYEYDLSNHQCRDRFTGRRLDSTIWNVK